MTCSALAGGFLRTSRLPTRNLLLLLLLRAYAWVYTLKVRQTLILVECLFATTLQPGNADYLRTRATSRAPCPGGSRSLAHAGGAGQGLTLVHFSAQYKLSFWDTLGA